MGLSAALRLVQEAGKAGDAGRLQRETFRARQDGQLSLLPTPGDVAAAEDQAEQARGPGRPAGSANRRTLQLARFIQAHCRDPVLFLASVYSRPVEQLAGELGCTKRDALALMIQSAREVAPYTHSKMPVAVDLSATSQVFVTFETSDEVRAMLDGGDWQDAQTIDGQVLSKFSDLAAAEAAQSDTLQSDSDHEDGGKPGDTASPQSDGQ